MSFLDELRRRNVVRMAALYAVASWLILQVADVLFDGLELPPTSVRMVLAVVILGFPVALIFSWVYEMTPGWPACWLIRAWPISTATRNGIPSSARRVCHTSEFSRRL